MSKCGLSGTNFSDEYLIKNLSNKKLRKALILHKIKLTS